MATTKARSQAGKKIIDGLQDVLMALKAGGIDRVKQQFRAARVKRTVHAPTVVAAEVLAIRKQLEVSQPVFAGLLGVSTNTVRAWEQGVNPLSRMAARFLDEVRRNPEYWKLRVTELMA